ncbi:D-alanyl-D-alanine dipeptidase [Salmonella enterica subsp. enterica serovar Typhimurium]|nr:D-alanyl-D-alanine dipeptidase [Salmonella enterica subsp. enterica]VFS02662.1 D-alanyl-D-alanine dipeptidase [Salmonella enterica subsp. enterica serovar Typhimurium]
MKKSDGEIHEKTASWGILQSEWLRKCGRLLLLLLYRFVIGWAFFQLLAMIVAGIFLLGILLFHPIIFVQTIAITEKLNHASLDLWHILKLCLWHYGIIAGFIFMAECTLSKSIRQVQRLSKKIWGTGCFFTPVIRRCNLRSY